MSDVRADNYGKRDGSSSIPADTLLQGSAKAWLNFNGTGTIAARDSFNISSLVDGGTGSYQAINSVAMPNANYAIPAAACSPSGGGPDIVSPFVTSVNTVDMRTSRTTSPSTLADSQQIFITQFGDPV